MNFCHSCGVRLTAECSYCPHCGKKLENEASTIYQKYHSVSLSRNPNNKVIFTDKSIHYKQRQIQYNEVSSVRFHALSLSVNLVPTRTDYMVAIKSKNDEINISISSIFGIQNRAKRAIFNELLQSAITYLFPYVIQKFVEEIAENLYSFKIGALTVNKLGLSRKKILSKPEFLNWENYALSRVEEGKVLVYKQNPIANVISIYAEIGLEYDNAIILPMLLDTLRNRLAKSI